MPHYEGIVLKSKSRDTEGNFITKFFSVEELASYVISNLKSVAETQSGRMLEEVVMGRPVFFSENQEEDKLAEGRLKEAASLSGFKSVHFIMEPIAAALYYERSRHNTSAKNVFIFDFGGGTLDACLLQLDPSLKISDKSLKSKVLSSYGITLGGNDLDKDIFSGKYLSYFGKDVKWGEKKLPMPSHIFNDIAEWHLIEQLSKYEISSFLRQVSINGTDTNAIQRLITLIQDQQVFAVLQSIEQGKIGLSSSPESRIKHDFKNIKIDDPFTIEEFEYLVAKRRVEIQKCITECLTRAQLKPDLVDAVLKVGGSSQNIFVDKILADNFGGKIESDNVFTSVVAGLSIAASEIFD